MHCHLPSAGRSFIGYKDTVPAGRAGCSTVPCLPPSNRNGSGVYLCSLLLMA